ncbi:MAG: deoxyribodipyrimidine photo-lyase [Candidatus Nanopelagicales bacterium]
MATVVWFRRDLRLGDHAALAAAGTDPVVGLFVLDPALLATAGPIRSARLSGSLRELATDIAAAGGRLVLRSGDPRLVVPAVAAEAEAERVLVSGDFAPYGLRRDREVAASLATAGRVLRSCDTPYLQAPGTVTKGDGSAFSVFTPFHRAWSALPAPAPVDAIPRWRDDLPGEPVPIGGADDGVGEAAALAALDRFVDGRGADYDTARNRPDLAGTSGLSAALRFGEIHPRTIVAAAAHLPGFVRQLCWRDFYADVLFRRPDAAWRNVDRRFDALPWTDDDEAFRLWCEGRTGFPMVDAGMRQLARDGWMHNRSRMVVASFLTKDLLIPWQRGARWFLAHLRDGDIANNSLGWQWTAGTGMDPAPFHRVFNPVLQGLRFDPDGDYVREFVPELRHLAGPAVHEPWDHADGYAHGYPARMVDHREARVAALAAFADIRGR